MAEDSEQRVAKMTDRFLGRPRQELMNDEEFLSLTQDELLALAAESRRRAEMQAVMEELSDES
jgi:hypothetical protein